MKQKSIALVLALVLVVGGAIGGTLAWLMDTTDTVTNTFTVGNIDIDLKEHDLVNGKLTDDEVTSEDTYKILPGTSQLKDPFVRVEKGSEACYVFVQVQEVNNTVPDSDPVEKYITYSVDSAWNLLDTANGIAVYYQEQDALTATDAQTATLNILADKTVSYSGDLSQDDINKLYTFDDNGNITATTQPQLIFKAFAVQKEAAPTSAAAAWALVDADEKLSTT